MVMGFFAILMIFALGVAYLSVTASSVLTSKRDTMRTRAMAAAEAGIDQAVAFIMDGGPGGETGGTWRTTHPSTDPNNHHSDTWYTGSLGNGATYKICCRNGSGVTAGKIEITSVGTVTEGTSTTSRALKAVLDCSKQNLNVWSNAIFGGVGQSGKSINGNVKIRGSVHLLGDGESYTDTDGDGHYDAPEPYTDTNHNGHWDPGEPYTDLDGDGHYSAGEPFQDVNGNGVRDPALTVTDLAEDIGGNADMGNNYNGMSATVRNLIPNPPTVSYGGETVDSLSAKLRVKHGKVNISGSACVGYANQTGNTVKETMDGVYVSDGFGGNAGAASVHSDNGTANGYDLPDGTVTMPLITYGSYTKGGTTYANYLTYLNQNATVYTGDLTIVSNTALTISGAKGSLTIDSHGNMTVSGIVYVTGNISLGDKHGNITYSGSGTLVTPNSVYVHGNVLPKTKFATTDTLGLVAAKNVELATGSGDSQLSMALAMYAQQQIISNKQNEVAGTMVTSYFSMSNVPSLYEVPELANHLPPAMPGSDPIYVASMSVVSWQEIAPNSCL